MKTIFIIWLIGAIIGAILLIFYMINNKNGGDL